MKNLEKQKKKKKVGKKNKTQSKSKTKQKKTPKETHYKQNKTKERKREKKDALLTHLISTNGFSHVVIFLHYAIYLVHFFVKVIVFSELLNAISFSTL